MIRFIICLLMLVFGLFFEITAVFGVYRFNTPLQRIHAASLGDTLGLFFILFGMAVANGLDLTAAKFLLLIFFMWNTSPVASHLIGMLEMETNEHLKKEVRIWKC